MNKQQLQKIISDYSNQLDLLNFNLQQIEMQKRALVSRQKFLKRKINILNEKIYKTSGDSINWSCDDFDNLDIYS